MHVVKTASLLIGLSLLSSGCLIARHKVTVHSTPPGATIVFRGKDLGSTPVEITTLWFPYSWQMSYFGSVTAEAPGYRSVSIDVGKRIARRVSIDWLTFFIPNSTRRLLGLQPRRTHTILLVRDHGQSGTWLPEEVEDLR